MKWAAAALAAIMYLAWPYWTLVDLTNSLKTGNAPGLNRLVDWEHVRASVKTQLQTQFRDIPQTPAQRDNPLATMFGAALAMTMANSMIDAMLTPEGIANMIRAGQPTPDVKLASAKEASGAQRGSYLRNVRFAFFISPFHFRLDLAPPDATQGSRLSLVLTFKGTGWQVTDIRLPASNPAPRREAKIQ